MENVFRILEREIDGLNSLFDVVLPGGRDYSISDKRAEMLGMRILRCFDGDIEGREFRELEIMLRQGGENLQYYCDFVDICCMLRNMYLPVKMPA